MDWEESAEWEPLCTFLGKDIPNRPFPQANEGQYFTGLSVGRLRNALGRIYRHLRNKTFR